MRLFVGVELDETGRRACAAAVSALQRQLTSARKLSVRWIPEENLHITLWFLGGLTGDAVSRVADAMRAPWTIEPFNLAIGGAGAFPPSGPPRILWFGVTEGADSLQKAYRDLVARFAPLGYAAERRPYHPHVTIGRIRSVERAAARKVRDAVHDSEFTSGSQRVASVTLFQSRLSPHGARYEALLRVPLKGC